MDLQELVLASMVVLTLLTIKSAHHKFLVSENSVVKEPLFQIHEM
jgi:hypothetical protein